ncbi:MAG TPA: hypothetical protein VJ482_10160, partial [Acidimicrobiia bacterium]|nr:hypothetical protein [Acidimicrobiia bacterium]
EPIDTGRTIESVNPCRPAEIVGSAAGADAQLAERAIETAWTRRLLSKSGLALGVWSSLRLGRVGGMTGRRVDV